MALRLLFLEVWWKFWQNVFRRIPPNSYQYIILDISSNQVKFQIQQNWNNNYANPDSSEYRELRKTIQTKVKEFTRNKLFFFRVREMKTMNVRIIKFLIEMAVTDLKFHIISVPYTIFQAGTTSCAYLILKLLELVRIRR